MKQNFLKIISLILGLIPSLQAMDNDMDVEKMAKKRRIDIDIKDMDVETIPTKVNPFEAYGVPTDLNFHIADLTIRSISSIITSTRSMNSNAFFDKLNPAEITLLLKTVFKKECSQKKYIFNQGNRYDLSIYNGDQDLSEKLYQTLCMHEHENNSLKYWLDKANISGISVSLGINSMQNGVDFGTNMNIICHYINQMNSLNLAHNYIELDDYSKILDLLKQNITLTSLNLSGNYMSSPQIAKLGELLGKNKTLTSLSVSLISRDSVNKEKSATKVARGLQENTTLTHLEMTFNDLEFYVGNMISEGLKYNTTLKSLILCGDYGDRAIANICSLLKKNTVLTTLNLTGTDHLPLMIGTLIKNKTLTSLILSNYGLSDYNRMKNYKVVKNIPNLVSLEKVGYKVVIETKEDVIYDGFGSSIGHVKFSIFR